MPKIITFVVGALGIAALAVWGTIATWNATMVWLAAAPALIAWVIAINFATLPICLGAYAVAGWAYLCDAMFPNVRFEYTPPSRRPYVHAGTAYADS